MATTRLVKPPAMPPLELFDGTFILHETGMTIKGRPTFAEYEAAGDFIRRAHKASGFWLGDWLRYGDSRADWRKHLSQAQSLSGLSERTLKNTRAVAGAVEPSRRRDDLEFSLHETVAGLPADDQDYWLRRAAEEGWNQRELRLMIRAKRRAKVIEGQAVLEGMYRVILADPAWTYDNRQPSGSSAQDHYPGMTIEQMCKLPVAAHALPNSVLFMWTTAPIILQNPGPREIGEAWGFCCQTGTRVLTADLRWLPAEALVVGDRLVSFDDNRRLDRRHFQWGTVLSTGIEQHDCYEIALADGTVLTSTGPHRWLMRTSAHGRERVMRWIRTDALTGHLRHHARRSELSMPRIAPVATQDRSYDAGFLAAAFDGEGSLTSTKLGLRFAQKENAFYRAVDATLRREGFATAHYRCAEPDLVKQLSISGGREATLRFLMRYRPPRLLAKWLTHDISANSVYNTEAVPVVSVKRVGPRPVVTLMTDTGTYIAEGFGAHNTYKTQIVWDKVVHNAGHYTGANHEILTIWTRGSCTPDVPIELPDSVQVIRRDDEHSAKPEEFRKIITKHWTTGPYLELFGRERHEGWSTVGNDARLWSEEFRDSAVGTL